jgi:thioredoxin 2
MNGNSYRVLRCDSCGQLNRLPASKLQKDSSPKCGKCKAALSLEPHPAMVTDENFQGFTNAPIPVLVDFWAPWCGPCHALAPTIAQISKEFVGQLLVGKLNTDENAVTASKFQIRGIPTMILFQNGREVNRLVGVQPKNEIIRQIQSLLNQ